MRLKDKYKNLGVLPKVSKADMERMMESIKEYLRLCHGAIRAPLAYIIRKTITIQTYGDDPMYGAPDDEMIAEMLHLYQTRINHTMIRVHDQSKSIQQSTR